MQAYTGFASVYDIFMDNVPYDEWTDYVTELLEEYHIKDGLVLELGCGTGSMTRRLQQKGYEMIGIDNSEDMLMIAREYSKEDNILYLCQDMREFELYGTVKAIISVCDSMNYLLEEEDLLDVFRLANTYLEKDGVFIFDLDTEYDYREVLGDNTIAESREEGSFIWENTYFEEEGINEVYLSIFLPEEDGLYRKHEEIHHRKAYPLERIKELIEEAGMECVAIYDSLTKEPPKEDSERVYIIAKEKKQENKRYI